MLRSFATNEQGSVIVPAAGLLLLLLGFGAFTADIGSFQYQRRKLQGAADMAAISAAMDPAHAVDRSLRSLQDSGYDASTVVSVAQGRYDADPARAPEDRFRDATPVNAVAISLATHADIVLGRVFNLIGLRTAREDAGASGLEQIVTSNGHVTIRASALATKADFAALAIGSRLAGLDGGVLNDLTSTLIGTRVSLTALDYRSLAGAKIDSTGFLQEIARRSGGTAETYGEVLSARVRVADVLASAAAHLRSATMSATMLTALASATDRSRVISLSGLIDLTPYGTYALSRDPPLTASVSALDILVAGALSLSGGRLALSSNLSATGLFVSSIQLAIGQGPAGVSTRVAAQGDAITTSQMRLHASVQLAVPGIEPALRIPLTLEIAPAQAWLQHISCSSDGDASLDVAARPAVARAWIGDLPGDSWSQSLPSESPAPATVASLPGLLAVTMRSYAEVTNQQPTSLHFTPLDVSAGTRRSVSTQDPLATVLRSAFATTQLTLAVGPLSLPAPLLDAAVRTALVSAADPLDGLLSTLLGGLGVSVGDVDVWSDDARCGGAVLVR